MLQPADVGVTRRDPIAPGWAGKGESGDGFGRGDAHGDGQRVACHIKVLTDFQRVRILSEQALFGEFLLLHRSLLLFAEKLDLVLEVFSKASDKGEPFLAVDHAVINAFLQLGITVLLSQL